MQNPKIEKNIEMPEIKKGGKQNIRYPWKQMEVGDSFFVKGIDDGYVRRAISQFHSTHKDGARFSSRKVEDGTRVWRVS